jgi:DNA repair protein RecO (recombination protein O)
VTLHSSPSTLPHSSLYRVEAVVLRHRDLGEADRVLTLFSREHGKLRASAKGVRKLKSRLAGHVEPLTLASLLLVRGRSLDIVSQAQALETYARVRGDLLATLHGLHMAELTDLFSEDYEPQPALFALLVDALRRLERGEAQEPLLRAFEMGVLEAAGYKPVLDRCVSCGRSLEGEAGPAFGAQTGGVVCSGCRRLGQEWLRAVSPRALEALRLLQRRGLEAAKAPVLAEAAVASELEALLRWYLHYILERPLETIVVLDQLRAGRGPG